MAPFIGIRLDTRRRGDLPLLITFLHRGDCSIRIDQADLGDVFLVNLKYFLFCFFLFLPFFAPAVGQRYGVGDALAHALCVFAATAAVFSFAFLMSSVFNELTRPLLITCAVAVVLSLAEQALDLQYGVYRLMSGETYFRSGALPWGALLTAAIVSASMLYGASINVAHQDF